MARLRRKQEARRYGAMVDDGKKAPPEGLRKTIREASVGYNIIVGMFAGAAFCYVCARSVGVAEHGRLVAALCGAAAMLLVETVLFIIRAERGEAAGKRAARAEARATGPVGALKGSTPRAEGAGAAKRAAIEKQMAAVRGGGGESKKRR